MWTADKNRAQAAGMGIGSCLTPPARGATLCWETMDPKLGSKIRIKCFQKNRPSSASKYVGGWEGSSVRWGVTPKSLMTYFGKMPGWAAEERRDGRAVVLRDNGYMLTHLLQNLPHAFPLFWIGFHWFSVFHWWPISIDGARARAHFAIRER